MRLLTEYDLELVREKLKDCLDSIATHLNMAVPGKLAIKLKQSADSTASYSVEADGSPYVQARMSFDPPTTEAPHEEATPAPDFVDGAEYIVTEGEHAGEVYVYHDTHGEPGAQWINKATGEACDDPPFPLARVEDDVMDDEQEVDDKPAPEQEQEPPVGESGEPWEYPEPEGAPPVEPAEAPADPEWDDAPPMPDEEEAPVMPQEVEADADDDPVIAPKAKATELYESWKRRNGSIVYIARGRDGLWAAFTDTVVAGKMETARLSVIKGRSLKEELTQALAEHAAQRGWEPEG